MRETSETRDQSGKRAKNRTNTKRIGASVPYNLASALEDSAAKRGVTVEAEIRIAIEAHLTAQGITYWSTFKYHGG